MYNNRYFPPSRVNAQRTPQPPEMTPRTRLLNSLLRDPRFRSLVNRDDFRQRVDNMLEIFGSTPVPDDFLVDLTNRRLGAGRWSGWRDGTWDRLLEERERRTGVTAQPRDREETPVVGTSSSSSPDPLIGHIDEDPCPICLEKLGTEEETRVLTRCGHRFHKECLAEWGRSCPICRLGPRQMAPQTYQSRRKNRKKSTNILISK